MATQESGTEAVMVTRLAEDEAEVAGWLQREQCGMRAADPASRNIVGTSVGSEKSVPEEIDHGKIGVRVQMVDEVKLLLAPEPSEACEARSLGMVLLVKVYVGAERRCAGGGNYDK